MAVTRWRVPSRRFHSGSARRSCRAGRTQLHTGSTSEEESQGKYIFLLGHRTFPSISRQLLGLAADPGVGFLFCLWDPGSWDVCGTLWFSSCQGELFLFFSLCSSK